MHRRVRETDWASTPVGPEASWPQSLRATVKTLLGSRYPMILLWGPALIQIYNDSYIGLIGDKHPTALGRSIRETQAESWEVIGPMIHEVMATGVPNWVPAQRLPLERAGYREESYFDLSYSAVEDDEGAIAGMLCVCSEVTQQVLGERRTRLLRDLAIRAGETRRVDATCRDIIETMAAHRLEVPFALLYLRDAQGGTLTLAGEVGLDSQTHGCPQSVSLAKVPDAAWPVGRAALGESIRIDEVEQKCSVRGGPWNDVVRSALLLPIPSSEPGVSLGVLVAGVSPNRALDEAYSSFLALLAGQVSVALRNARAYEDQRRRAEALAELDRAKTAFFSNVSHEFRTPLTLMLGPLEDLLARSRLAEEDREALELVHRNAGRLLRLVNTLLDFSRFEPGERVEGRFEPTDLAGFTADLASTFRSAVERAGLQLNVDCAPLSAPAYVDRDMWEKVVLNLLSNALKFTFSGAITVRLREEPTHTVLEVSDTGTGIPASQLPQLFQRFHRVHGARSRSHEGSGIGLALVQELVKRHGGEVSVASTEGEGTTFSVRLPVGRAHLPADAPGEMRPREAASTHAPAFLDEAAAWLRRTADHPPRETGTSSSTAPRRRILVADDNADMRDYLERILSASFEVVTAEDGQEALEKVRRAGDFDLVLTDVMMPRLDGMELLAALRGDPATRSIPIVMLSARAGEEASLEGLEAGADDYLIKPFSARELIARTRSALELATMRKELATHEARRAFWEESVRARDEFLSVASHELKTPLAAFRLQLEMMDRSLPDDAPSRLRERIAAADRQVKRLAQLVETFLDVSLIASGKLELQAEEVDVSGLVCEAVARLKRDSQPDSTPISFSGQSGLVGRFDRQRLTQVVSTLLTNAGQYGQGEPVDVTVGAAEGGVRITFVDRGIGIAREDRARIFERFERAVSGRNYGGLGLGLWIARQLVEAHGGTIGLNDTPGGGTTFSVELPL